MATFTYVLALFTGIPVIAVTLALLLTVCVGLTTNDTDRRRHARAILRDLIVALRAFHGGGPR